MRFFIIYIDIYLQSLMIDIKKRKMQHFNVNVFNYTYLHKKLYLTTQMLYLHW